MLLIITNIFSKKIQSIDGTAVRRTQISKESVNKRAQTKAFPPPFTRNHEQFFTASLCFLLIWDNTHGSNEYNGL